LQLPAGITEEALFQWGVVFGTSLAAAIFDLRSKRIPNALTIPLLVAGLVWATWIGGLSGLGNAAAACFLLALPYVFLFLFAKGGAGDAKLMGAIGAWLGLRQGILVLLCVAVAAIVISLASALVKKRLKIVIINVIVSVYDLILSLAGYRKIRNTTNRMEDKQAYDLTIPYAVAVFAGVCVAAVIVLIW
jgi:prepilin peptidase CpaA